MNLDMLKHEMQDINIDGLMQNFIKELSNFIEEKSKGEPINMNGLKEEGAIYQVVDVAYDGVFLENKNDHKVYKEKDMEKDLLNRISNDTFLMYQDGKYVIDEELTQEFYDNLENSN